MRFLLTYGYSPCYTVVVRRRGAFGRRREHEMTNITMNIDGMDFWTLVGLVNSASEVAGNDEAIDAINGYLAENRKRYEKEAVENGDTEAIDLMNDVLGMEFATWIVENDTPSNWDIVERAARDYSAKGMSGRVKGLCDALSCMSDCATSDVREFVADYAKEWYEDGKRID